MSQPQTIQIMFYSEGQTSAVLVTNKEGIRSKTFPRFATPGRALSWCRKHRATFTYTPAAPNN